MGNYWVSASVLFKGENSNYSESSTKDVMDKLKNKTLWPGWIYLGGTTYWMILSREPDVAYGLYMSTPV